MPFLMSFWPSDVASGIGDVCSLVGVCLTIFLTSTALKVRRQFQKLILLPVSVANLEQHCNDLSDLMKPGASRAEMGRLLGMMEGTLNTLTRDLGRSERQAVVAALAELHAYNGMPTPDALGMLHQQMWRLVTELKDTTQRNQWNR